jgi:ribosomal protein S27AE
MQKRNFFDKIIHRNRWKLRSCPRCKGDLFSFYGENFTCLQCGWVDYNEKLGRSNHGK